MRISCDPEADAAMIYLVDLIKPGEAVEQVVVDDVPGPGELVLDFDASGRILAIEVIGASRLLPEGLVAGLEG
ncbi:DUF2283 domain-containing protein [Kitasatospora sp. CM 4170]|uniref:DUF2283 domain-containing protein n=1 Tax=Kitasatospora aburaviensis TaxID=67265 RepID=A0ABW1ENK4_9ACTN|nr:DUF2283 domain-containing protein [Kitasatospora sp. CM 4170]WNM48378.1 DUF2283 domain-containing protein [Kitasatospora sp. CM 4170]